MQNLFTLHIAALLLFASSHLAVADFSFTEKDGTLQLLDDGKVVTAFRNDYRFPYLYPLPSPSGANIACHWPSGAARLLCSSAASAANGGWIHNPE
jgi:hypothetical protein